jgi:hypothetical protein
VQVKQRGCLAVAAAPVRNPRDRGSLPTGTFRSPRGTRNVHQADAGPPDRQPDGLAACVAGWRVGGAVDHPGAADAATWRQLEDSTVPMIDVRDAGAVNQGRR